MRATKQSGLAPSRTSGLQSPLARRSSVSDDPMTRLGIEIREVSARSVVVAVAGELDLSTAHLLAGALNWYRDCDVVVDLSAVGFLGSSGLTVLVHARKQLLRTGHTLRTTGENGIVLAAMRIVGLEDTFHARSTDEADAP